MDLSFDYEPKMSREAMKNEALERMELLDLPVYAKAALKKSDILTLSDINDLDCSSRVDGVPEEILKQIRAWEEKYGNFVYHVIHSVGVFEMYNCLSVSGYGSDWDYERGLMEDSSDVWSMAFCVNVTKPEYTEAGSIMIENHSGVLKRVL